MNSFQRFDLQYLRKSVQPQTFLQPLKRRVIAKRVISDSGSGSYVAPSVNSNTNLTRIDGNNLTRINGDNLTIIQ